MASDASTIIIEVGRRPFLPVRELLEFRELLYFLTWRDIKVRYKQTLIGAGWALIQPIVTIVVFSTIFGRVARMGSEGIPYPIFAYAGLLPWQLFAGGLQRAVQSLVHNAQLVKKVYFPRLILPLAATVSAAVDFGIAFTVYVAMSIGYGLMPTWRVIALPALVGIVMLAALAVGLWLAALNVRYRDIGHGLPFLIQIWMFASPVVYSVGLVRGHWKLVYSLNPMVGVIEGFRWALVGKAAPDLSMIALGSAVMLCLLVGGLVFFRHMERTFADVI